jgi:hypothetical protein
MRLGWQSVLDRLIVGSKVFHQTAGYAPRGDSQELVRFLTVRSNHPRDTGRQFQELNPLTARPWRSGNSTPDQVRHSAVVAGAKRPVKPTIRGVWAQTARHMRLVELEQLLGTSMAYTRVVNGVANCPVPKIPTEQP